MTTELDDLDRRLVHRLAEELPLDLTAVAREVGTTPEDAHERLLRLRGAGVVRECVAQIDPAAVGLGCTAFLLVRVAQNADNFASIRQILGDLEAVEEAHAVGGDFDNPAGWDINTAFHALTYGLAVVMANRVGTEGDLTFWGGSRVLDAHGRVLARAEERETLLKLTKAEGKPEAAWDKIVEGRLTGWYKERVLLDQPFVRDEKQSVAQLVSGRGASIARFGQLFIGG